MTVGAAVAVIGIGVLIGWAAHIDMLRQIIPGSVGMKANTAVGFVLCGSSMVLGGRSGPSLRSRLAVALALVAIMLGGLSLFEELAAKNLGIDELLFTDPVTAASLSRPGRMSPATAFCFVLIGAALAMFAAGPRTRALHPLAASFSATVSIISAMLLTAHLSHRVIGWEWGATSAMAIHTAFAFLALGLACLHRADRDRTSTWALGRLGATGFAVSVMLTVGASELGSSFAQDMKRTTDRVLQAEASLLALQSIRTELRALESAQRAHLLSANDSFIADREAVKRSVRTHVEGIEAMSGSDAAARERSTAFRQAVEQRLDYGDRMIVVQRQQGRQAASAMFNTGGDVALTAAITTAIAPMVQLERDRLTRDAAHLKSATTTTFLTLPIASFLGLTVLMASLFFLDRGLSRRRRAEDELARNRVNLQIVFNSLSEGIRVVDSDHAITRMNPAGATVHGLIAAADSLEAIVAEVDAVTADGAVLGLQDWPASKALRGEFAHNMELTFRHKHSDRFVIAELTTARVPGEPGESDMIVVTSHDVTEQRLAQAGVEESRLRLERVAENLPDGLLVHGIGALPVHWNNAALRMFDFERGQVEGKNRQTFRTLLELRTMDDELLPFDQWPMSRLMRGELTPPLELRVSRRNTDWSRYFRFEGVIIPESSGKLLVFLTVTDETARKTAELALKALNADLERRVELRTAESQSKQRELESFCYSVSHDLKAPLRGIDGYSRLLSEEFGGQLNEEGRKFIANVRQGASHMNALIDDLLAYSRQDRNALVPIPILVQPFVDDLLAACAADLGGVQITLHLDNLVVQADRDGLAMALRNLLDNAIKFSARSSPPEISIDAHVSGDNVVISVKDNGTGFDMRYYDKIFEIFQRLHRVEDFPGTGVGLAMVRKAIERMRGRVWAESSPGQGATFFVELPAGRRVHAGSLSEAVR